MPPLRKLEKDALMSFIVFILRCLLMLLLEFSEICNTLGLQNLKVFVLFVSCKYFLFRIVPEDFDQKKTFLLQQRFSIASPFSKWFMLVIVLLIRFNLMKIKNYIYGMKFFYLRSWIVVKISRLCDLETYEIAHMENCGTVNPGFLYTRTDSVPNEMVKMRPNHNLLWLADR